MNAQRAWSALRCRCCCCEPKALHSPNNIYVVLIEKALSDNTIKNYATDLARLTHYAYQRKQSLATLQAKDLGDFIAQLSRDGLSPATVRRIASTVRGFYLFLALDNHIDNLPSDDLRTPPPVSYLPTFLSETEIHQLLAAPDLSTKEGLRDRAILELMYAAGLRVSEVVTLRQCGFGH